MFGKHYFKTYQGVFLRAFKLLDLMLIGAVIYLIMPYLLSAEHQDTISTMGAIVGVLTFMLVSDRTNIYRPWRGKRQRHEFLLVVFVSGTTLILTLLTLLAAGSTNLGNTTVQILASWFAAQTALLILIRLSIRSILKIARMKGFNIRRIVFVGISDQVEGFLEDLERHPEFGIECVGYIDERANQRTENKFDFTHLGKTNDLVALIEEHDIDQVWFAYPISANTRTAAVIEQLKYSTVAIRQILESGEEQPRVTGILGMPLIDIDVAMTDGFLGGMFKTLQDKVIAAIVLILTSPLLLGLALGVKLSSPGPVFYRQTRVTWKNEPFEILKFRSMPVNAEFAGGGTSWASRQKNTTKFGEFLRSSSMDELPQFINVLRGEMSIIGPRPERPVYVEQFKDEIPRYMKKHRVKAGITGWAQVNGLRGDTDLSARIDHDLYYIKNWSPMLDLEIALRTVFNGFFKSHS